MLLTFLLKNDSIHFANIQKVQKGLLLRIMLTVVSDQAKPILAEFSYLAVFCLNGFSFLDQQYPGT